MHDTLAAGLINIGWTPLLQEGESWVLVKQLDKDLAMLWLEELRALAGWKQEPITLYGRTMMQPRLVKVEGDEGVGYKYSGRRYDAGGWSSIGAQVRERMELETGLNFNYALMNWYRDGEDSMGWHADDEPELGKNPSIASLSLGGTRDFMIRQRQRKGEDALEKESMRIPLEHGMLLLMGGRFQEQWQHSLPKRKRQNEERINLTFRRIVQQ